MLLVLAFSIECGWSQLEASTPPLVTHYRDDQAGIPSTSFDVAQDYNGVLYFASKSLLTFDGDRWSQTAVPDAFGIRRLHFGPDGRLWVAATTNLGWFAQDAHGTWTFHSLLEFIPPEHRPLKELWAVAADDRGATFITEDKILRWDGEKFRFWHHPTEKRLAGMHADGRFFVHDIEQGIFEVDADGPRLFISAERLGAGMIISMERRANDWLLGTGNGFLVYDGRTTTPFASERVTEIIKHHALTDVVRLPDGRLLASTAGAGILILAADGELESQVQTDAGLPANSVRSLKLGRDREVWATTSAGIVRLDFDARSTFYGEGSGLPRQRYHGIAKVGDTLVVANETGVYSWDAKTNRFSPLPSLAGRWPSLQSSTAGLLVGGFRIAKLWREEPAITIHETRRDVFSLLLSRIRPDEILISDNRSIIGRSNTTVREIVTDLPDNATSMVEDAEGRLWLGTLGRGVFFARPQAGGATTARSAGETMGLPKLTGPTHVHEITPGNILVFAAEGAWHLGSRAREFVAVANFPRVPATAVADLSSADAIWTAHADAATGATTVGRVVVRNGLAVWEGHEIQALAHLGSPESIFAEQLSDGSTRLWLGGTQGVLRHDVGRSLQKSTPRRPLLRAFARATSTSDRLPIEKPLPYATRAIDFEFAATEYAKRPLLRIESRIEGVDDAWVRAGESSSRELTAVRDGRYTIRARVVAETGAVSEETTFAFQVLKPWWRAPETLLGGALLVLVSGVAGFRLRMRSLRRHNAALEAKVRQRTEELERASAAKTEFVANMSHDIRNPLNGIVGLALALEDTRLDTRQREIVATLRECTTYLSTLVDDVLDFASIEAGRVELRPGPFSPQQLLRSVVETSRTDAAERSATITTEVQPALPSHLVGDAGRIQQILVNFVSNALKYASGQIHLSVTTPGDSVDELEFAVTDCGPGLSPEEQTTVFAKFSRLDRDRQKEIPGSGLGLAACRLLADIMGGSVGVQSRVGHGARFFLRLPLVASTERQDVAPARLPNTTVLLVEDADYNAWAATAVLAKLGLTCDRARTGEEALTLFQGRRYNVVLLDRNLPDMDGIEVARKMREFEADGAQAIILAVTAYCTAEDRSRCLEAGMDAFLGKPLTPEKLRRVLLAAGRRLLTAASLDVPEERTSPRVDTSLLSYLSDGTESGLEAQVQRFVASLSEAESELAAATQRRDFNGVRLHAHRLVGQAKMVGGDALAHAASSLESAAINGLADGVRSALASVVSEIRVLTEAMRHPATAARTA